MEEHSIEQGFLKLEEIIENMDSKDISLEDSFALYKDGIAELEYCNSKIEQTKKAVMAIQNDGSLKVFEEDE